MGGILLLLYLFKVLDRLLIGCDDPISASLIEKSELGELLAGPRREWRIRVLLKVHATLLFLALFVSSIGPLSLFLLIGLPRIISFLLLISEIDILSLCQHRKKAEKDYWMNIGDRRLLLYSFFFLFQTLYLKLKFANRALQLFDLILEITGHLNRSKQLCLKSLIGWTILFLLILNLLCECFVGCHRGL